MPKRRRRSRRKSDLPKGAYRLPDGGYVSASAPMVTRDGKRQLRVRGVHRAAPDPAAIAEAILAIVIEAQRKADEQTWSVDE